MTTKDIPKQRRRGQKIKNKMKKFVLMYVNARGIKAKQASFLTKVDEIKPTIICITETHLIGTIKCDIEGYDVRRSDRDIMGGGIMIAVKNEIKHVCTKVEDKKNVGECMWIVIDNQRIKIRLGLIYAPQESRSKKEVLKVMYEEIKEQIGLAKERQQKIVIIGDLNCKIGEEIPGNRKDVTTGGRLLMKMVEMHKLIVLNKTSQCEGLWTRTDDKTRSVIDYIIADEESEKALEKMVIDEEGDLAPESQGGKCSDHNLMTARFNWVICEQRTEGKRKITTKKGYAQIGQKMEEEEISRIFEEDTDIQTCYDKWKRKVEEIEESCKIEIKKKNPRKSIKDLVKYKKEVKDKMKKVSKEERRTLIAKRKEIDERIKDENKKQFENKIKKSS